jgi:hypothetical protein
MNLPYHASGERDYITMRTLTVVRQYLAAAFLLVIGLIAYGCGDSATVNPVVELASLTVDPGTLQPAFSGGTTQYNVDVSSNITSVTITAQPAVAGDSVTINGQATTSSVIPLGAAGTTTPVSIVVSETGTNSRTYTVLLVRAGLTGNNSLQNLTVSSGTLAPAFDPNLQAYTVNVANNVTSITVSATKSDPNAVMQIGSVTVGAGTATGQASIPLGDPGSNTPVSIVVTAQNGNGKAYTVTVSRGVSGNNNLQSLTISPGTLSPSFSAGTVGYTVNVASTVTSVTVTPTRQDPAATITMNGTLATSGQGRSITLNGAGSNTFINIVVTAQIGTQKTYSVNVIRAALGGNNNLSALTVTPGPLAPTFTQNTLNYTVNVATTVTSITVTPTRQDPNATITMNGTPATSGQGRSITLNGAGSNTLINILVTAPNGIQKTYTVNVNRAALGGNNNLSALTVSPGPLDDPFNANDLSYTVDVATTVTSVNVAATKADPNAVMSGSVTAGAGTASGQATIQLGGPGTTRVVLITVTAPNGNSKTYSITVERAAQASNNNLSALSVSPGTLVPVFNANTTSYTVNVANDVTSVNVSATKADLNAVMSGSVTAGTGIPTGQATIPLNGAGTPTPVSITVTAPNQTSKTYNITMNRAAPAAPLAPASPPNLTAASDSGISQTDNITNVLTPSFTVATPGAGETPNLYINGQKVKEGFDQGANTLTPTTPLASGEYDITVTSTVTNAAGLESPPSLSSLSVHIDNVPPGGP